MASKSSRDADQDQFSLGPVPVSDKEPSTNLDSLPPIEPIKKPAIQLAVQVAVQGSTTDQISAVVNTYRKEFEESFEGLRQRSIGTQEERQLLITNATTSIEPIKQDIISTITATTDIPTPPLVIVHTFGWASVLLFAVSVSSIFGANVFAPLIGVFVGKIGAALIAAIGIPIYGYYMIKQDESDNASDSVIRFGLLGLALVQGLLSGFVLSETYVLAQPLAFLFSATITLVYPFAQSSLGVNRLNLLVTSIGAAFSVNLIAGFLTGNLTITFLLLTVLYSAVLAITMQFVYRNIFSTEQRLHLYQLALLATFVAVKLAVFGICGGEKEDFLDDPKHG